MRHNNYTTNQTNTQADQQWRNWQAVKAQRDERERRAVSENAEWAKATGTPEHELRGMFA